jgi:hypothetical protein
MLRNLMQVMSELTDNADEPLPVTAWRQAVMMLLSQLSVKRKRASLEETLPDHTLSVLIRAMPEAVPELGQVGGGALLLPEMQEAILRGPSLRAALDERVLNLSCLEAQQLINEKQVLNSMILSLVKAVTNVQGLTLPQECEIQAEPAAGGSNHAWYGQCQF